MGLAFLKSYYLSKVLFWLRVIAFFVVILLVYIGTCIMRLDQIYNIPFSPDIVLQSTTQITFNTYVKVLCSHCPFNFLAVIIFITGMEAKSHD